MTTRVLIFDAVSRYLDAESQAVLKDKILKVEFVKSDRKFVEIIRKSFDIEKFKNTPVYPEDILLYNYLQYDFNGKSLHGKLLIKYMNFLKKLNNVK